MARRKGPKGRIKITSMTNQQKIRSLRVVPKYPVRSQWESINEELLKTKKRLEKMKVELAKVKEDLARAQDELAKLKGEYHA